MDKCDVELMVEINVARVKKNPEYKDRWVTILTRSDSIKQIRYEQHDDWFGKIIDIGEK